MAKASAQTKPTPGLLAEDDAILHFLREAPLAHDLEALTSLFEQVVTQHGFSHFFCAFVASPGTPAQPEVLFGRPHLPSAQQYVAQKLAAHDPVVQHIFSSPASFTWTEVKERPLTPQQWRVFANAEAHGFLDGLVVPVHGPGGAIWVTVLLSRSTIRLDAQSRATITAAATLYATSGAALAAIEQEIPRPSPLTRRESQCLAWASRGKSDWEIARILKIRDKTVNMHIDSARKKLGVSTRSQAALEAWKRGWLLDYPD